MAISSFAPSRSLRPVARPSRFATVRRSSPVKETVVVRQAAIIPAPKPKRTESKRAVYTPQGQKIGRICRDRDLQGVEVGRVPGALPGCGIKDAVKLYSVSGVVLTRPVTVECDTARALKTWVEGGMDRAVGRTGGGVARLQVAAGYSCRTRNHRKGAKISEHGKGRAIDISGFHLENGDKISVLEDWGRGRYGRILKKMHKAACGPFGTVLGPNSDRFHKDHFHFDTARHRSGAYCR
ncbi:extensin family protein [Cognatishimia maritima]|uniref:extensin-like domain-containing protein n=1 Tax=Cognatishimia maritima TaxID=870908 RepID=UPI001F60493B|nr:extensin family protein [Cognatishimia maritima]